MRELRDSRDRILTKQNAKNSLSQKLGNEVELLRQPVTVTLFMKDSQSRALSDDGIK